MKEAPSAPNSKETRNEIFKPNTCRPAASKYMSDFFRFCADIYILCKYMRAGAHTHMCVHECACVCVPPKAINNYSCEIKA